MMGFRTSLPTAASRLPLLVERQSSQERLHALVASSRPELEQLLLEHGALLFRGFRVDTPDLFDAFLRALGSKRLEYLYRSTPRTPLGNDIYTATEYPPGMAIPFHNENAYQRDWPMKLAFCCVRAARAGGETPLADMRDVTRTIGPRLCEAFETRQVRYTRHYREHVDLPWQTVFQTSDRSTLASICSNLGMKHEWLEESVLRTVQVCQGMATHPLTHDRIFFNQAHLFHASALDAEAVQLMKTMFGNDRLPRHSQYGDGEEISLEDLRAIRSAFQVHEVQFDWQQGDVLLLDNMQVAHARRPFAGPRKVLAALMDAYSTIARY